MPVQNQQQGGVDVLRIRRSKSADTRSAEHEVTKGELLYSSEQHIGDVRQAMRYFAERLLRAADKHDCTKIDGIDQFHKDFRQVQQQGGNFKELPWYRRHVAEERHHLTDRVPDDVNLLDVLEWVADITMAGMARHGAVLPDSLSPEVLLMAYQNTITQLKNEIKVED